MGVDLSPADYPDVTSETELASILDRLTSGIPVSGPVTDAELRASAIPVSGPLTDAQLRASAVPVAVSGVATQVTLAQILSALAGVLTANIAGAVEVTNDSGNPLPVSGPLTDTALRASAVPVSGPLTDALLRATPVPVSVAGVATQTTVAAILSALASVAVTGPLTDAALRATPVPVSVAGVATQTTLAAVLTALASVPVTGPLTDAALRASAVPVDASGHDLTNIGKAAVGAAAAGNPLRSAGVGSSVLPALVANGQIADLWLTLGGAMVMGLAGTLGTGVGNGPGGFSDLNGALRALAVHPMGVNGAGTRDVLTRNRATTVLASAIRAATTNGPDTTNYNARGCLVFLNVTANPGGAETLTVNLQMKDSVTGVYKTIASSPALSAAANGAYVCSFYPGATAAVTGTSGLSANVPTVLPETYRVQVAHSAAGNWTYSVGQHEIL